MKISGSGKCAREVRDLSQGPRSAGPKKLNKIGYINGGGGGNRTRPLARRMVRCSGGIEQKSVSCRGKRGVRARIARTAAPSRWQRGPMGPRPSNASTWRVAFGANSACSMRSATMCTGSRGQPPASSSWSSDRLSHYRSVRCRRRLGRSRQLAPSTRNGLACQSLAQPHWRF